MYTLEELNVHLLSELKEIAEKLEVTNFKKLPKKELIYKILDKQAITPEKDLPSKPKAKVEAKPKAEPKQDARPARKNPRKPAAKKEEKESADDL